MQRFTVNSNDEGQRLDKFVQKTVWGMPLSLVYKFIRTKRIKVNGKRSDFSYKLRAGDVVEMFIPDDFNKKSTSPEDYLRERFELRVVYEDDNILVCDKPVGLLVHPGDEGENDSDKINEKETLLFRIKSYLAQKGEFTPENENSFAPALCNRIDRNTGGLVIAAKNAKALRNMNEEIKAGGVEKRYICAVHGAFSDRHAVLTAFLKKDPLSKRVFVTEENIPDAKRISTEYSVLSYNKDKDLSLVEVILHTGRTHQIRAHFAFLGHALLGDGKYANNKSDRAMGWSKQALYSYCVRFDPQTPFFEYLRYKEIRVDLENVPFTKLFDN